MRSRSNPAWPACRWSCRTGRPAGRARRPPWTAPDRIVCAHAAQASSARARPRPCWRKTQNIYRRPSILRWLRAPARCPRPPGCPAAARSGCSAKASPRWPVSTTYLNNWPRSPRSGQRPKPRHRTAAPHPDPVKIIFPGPGRDRAISPSAQWPRCARSPGRPAPPPRRSARSGGRCRWGRTAASGCGRGRCPPPCPSQRGGGTP